ncbi:MAG: hypothetical protein M3126_11485 [Candidatus Eremiobacteraeota bacterium]|nr:hypothetical protein [Candidatus Eremiobacteraeota bacterium]
MSEYSEESGALDTDLLQVIHAWHRYGTELSGADFNHLALRVFAYQLRYNRPYAQYCASVGISLQAMPDTWEAIPPVPSAAFKGASIATFDTAHAALTFETSGTTLGRGGRHYMENAALYDAALLAGFDVFVLSDALLLRYFNAVPNPALNPHSSLGYMMAQISAQRGDGRTGWYITDESILANAFAQDLRAAIDDGAPVCVAGTAFGLVALLDTFSESKDRFTLPPGSRIMETGGFKGRSRVLSREDFYAQIAATFGVDRRAIVAEYGMTELTSQYYDSAHSREQSLRVKISPPWLRARVVDAAGATVPNGIVGALVHVDLANRSSALAIGTEDLGCMTDDGLVLLGREAGAALRGCSLDAEDLRV